MALTDQELVAELRDRLETRARREREQEAQARKFFDAHGAAQVQARKAQEELSQAHLVIRCLLHLAGGRVEISEELLVSMDRGQLMRVDTPPASGMTITLER